MSKEQFLKELSSHLRKLPDEERKDILFDYEEHFQFGIEEGKTESEIIKGAWLSESNCKRIACDVSFR